MQGRKVIPLESDGDSGRDEPMISRGRGVLWWAVAALGVVVVVFAILFVFLAGWRTGEWWPSNQVGRLKPAEVFDLVRSCATIAATFAGAAAIAVAIRRQRSTEQSVTIAEHTARISAKAQETAADAYVLDQTRAERERIDRLRDRYTVAAEQLGHESAAVRLAGVYAMAALADDWLSLEKPDHLEAQVCIDVLCAHQRTPRLPETDRVEGPPDTREASRDEQVAHVADTRVRETITRVIADHLRVGQRHTRYWRGIRLDFSGATFSGDHDFARVDFEAADADFTGAKLHDCNMSFDWATFRRDFVSFGSMEVDDNSTLSFTNAEFKQTTVSFSQCVFRGLTDFTETRFDQSTVHFIDSTFEAGRVLFLGTSLADGMMDFGASVYCGSEVDFLQTRLVDGHVTFAGAEFRDGTVDFSETRFEGGSVGFTSCVVAERGPVAGPWGDDQPLPLVWPEPEEG